MNPDWLVPQWPAPERVHAICTTRAGGVSLAPFDSLNLGGHVGDRPPDVAANRAIFQRAIGVPPVFLAQVHGTHCTWLSADTAHGTLADACITDLSQVACTIMVADCLPVLLTNQQGSLVAAVHAGWRSLAGSGEGGVLEAVIARFMVKPPVEAQHYASEIIAWLGPCIGPQTFEVGGDVRDAFVSCDQAALAMFTPCGDGKWLADLPGLARMRLNAMGITQIYGNVGSRPWCTISNPSRFFSHRRDRVSGRMAASIWLA